MKYFSFNKNHSAVLITVLVVVFLGSLYFFIYVPQNEKRLQEQRFRTLQNVHNNIQAKIDNSIALMKGLLKPNTSTSYISYLSNQSKARFTLTTAVNDSVAATDRQQVNDTGFTTTISNSGQLIVVQVLKKQKVNGKAEGLAMQFTADQFIKSLLPENVFDQYIVCSNGGVVFETFPSGISYLEDSLLQKQHGISSAAVKSLTIGGNDFKAFLQPVSFVSKTKWVIAGLLSNKRYQAEKNQLPSNIVLLLLTAVLVIIVAFPWIKLYQMGSKDRLTVSDGVASIVVAMLLTSLLFFSFFKYNVLLRPHNSPDAKKTLSNQLINTFSKEIQTSYSKLRAADSLVQNNNDLLANIHDLNTDSMQGEKKIDARSLSQVDSLLRDIKANQVFWLDNNGEEKANWITGAMNAPHGNFAHRMYFKNIVENRSYHLMNDTSKRFFLDQVISWTTGKFTSVISIPSKVQGQSIAALSFDMESVARPLLTTGYQFAIIDNSGKVLYHADPARNLNENVIAEFSQKDKLVSSLQSRTEDVFLTKYFSKNYNVRITPIPDLPYFIMIFSDTSFKETRDLEIYSFTFSMMLILFAVLILQLFVVFIVSARQSFFKKQMFSTGWIGPKKPSHHQYNLASLYNMIVIAMLGGFITETTFLTFLFILLVAVNFISLFLNFIFALKYKQLNEEDNLKFKRNSIVSLIVFIIIINIAAFRCLDVHNYVVLVFFQLLSIVFGCVIFFTGEALLRGGRKLLTFFRNFPYSLRRDRVAYPRRFTRSSKQWNFAASFSLMALTRVIITSGIPILAFYLTAYNFEQSINIRYRQLQFANELEDKLGSEKTLLVNSSNNTFKGYYFDSAWIRDIHITEAPRIQPYSQEEIITTKMLRLFRLLLTKHAVNQDKLYTTNAPDSSIWFNPLLKNAIRQDSSTITYKATAVPGKYLAIGSYSLNYELPSIFSNAKFEGLLFWLMLLVALFAFFTILTHVIKKLFCLKLPDLQVWQGLDDKILTTAPLNSLVLVVGLPGSGKLAQIKEKILQIKDAKGDPMYILDENKPSTSNVFIADMINIPDDGDNREKEKGWQAYMRKVLAEQNKLIIVNHFEYNILDTAANRVKLNLLENLMLKSKAKIIILSTLHPVAFLETIQEQATGKDKELTAMDLERWHILLGHFRIVILPLALTKLNDPNSVFETIHNEMNTTHFLNRMLPVTKDIAATLPLRERSENMDELTFKLHMTSQYFYMYIWHSLTKEEKFLLYDLAEDNLVNSFDDYNLNMLIAKGIIIRPDGTLTLFNQGFRNFVLTAIGNSEAMKIKENIRENGNWSRLKNPLLIIILAILTFLLSSQEEAYSKLITYVAALAAGIPTILKITSLFGSENAKKTT